MCVDLKKLTAVSNNCGGNLGGVVSKVLVAKLEDIESIPSPAVVPANQKVVVGDIVMKPGKFFYEWNFQKNTGQLDSNSVGTVGSKSFEDMFEAIMPRQTLDNMEQLFHNINTEFVVIAKDNNGRQVIIGGLDQPAQFEEIKATTGKQGSDAANLMFKFKAISNNGFKYYTGVVPVAA
jgi:hypothetical protein